MMDDSSDGSGTRRWRTRRLLHYDYANPDHAYFVTVCARPGTAPFDDPQLAAVVLSALTWLRQERAVSLYAFCLMPDHLHLLLRLGSSQWTLGEIMHSLKGFTTRRSWELGWQGALWQSRFHDHILRRSEDGRAIAEYILQNPERKGLVREASEYPYSGLPDPM
jgi:putative transposase